MRLNERDRRALSWLQHFARSQLTAAKRRRKYRSHEVAIDEKEAETLRALIQIEQGAGRLLQPRGPA